MNKLYKVKLRTLDNRKFMHNRSFSGIQFCLNKKEIIVRKSLLGAVDILTGKHYPVYRKIAINSLFDSFILKRDFTKKNLATDKDIAKYYFEYYDEKNSLNTNSLNTNSKIKVRK